MADASNSPLKELRTARKPRPSARTWAVAAILSIVALALYSYTAAPDLTLVDSGELALAAYTGGVAHPPGFPLFVLVGWVFSHLPLGSPVRALNLMSAFFTALSVGMVFLACERLIVLLESLTSRGAKSAEPSWRKLLPSIAAAVAWMTARNPWSWSGVTEVYALNIFLTSGVWFFALAWACGEVGARSKSEKKAGAKRKGRVGGNVDHWLILASLFATLGLANHHITAALSLVPLFFILAATNPRVILERRFLIVFPACLAGSLALYLYLPLAARNDPGLGWGGIDSLALLIDHMTGRQYYETSSFEPARMVGAGADLLKWLLLDTGPLTSLVVVGGLAAALMTLRGRTALLIAVGAPFAMIAFNFILVVIYVAGAEDAMAYHLPAHHAWCLLVGVNLWAMGRRWPVMARARVIVPVLVAIMGLNVWRNIGECNLREEKAARQLVEDSLQGVPPGSVVFSSEWNFYSPYLYMKHVENYRPELSVVDLLLMRRFWYMPYLERTVPELIEPSRSLFTTFKGEVTRFDRGESYDAAKLSRTYPELMLRWAEIGGQRGSAYVEFGGLDRPQEREWIQRMASVPDGLLVRLDAPGRVPDMNPIPPKDRANLQRIYSRIGLADGEALDITAMPPWHVAYGKVYRIYLQGVEASLLLTLINEGEAAAEALASEYGAWFPSANLALEGAREKLRAASRSATPGR